MDCVVWLYVVITPWKTLCRSTSSQGMSPETRLPPPLFADAQYANAGVGSPEDGAEQQYYPVLPRRICLIGINSTVSPCTCRTPRAAPLAPLAAPREGID